MRVWADAATMILGSYYIENPPLLKLAVACLKGYGHQEEDSARSVSIISCYNI